MTAPLLLDLSHTSHTRARTGVQRVARALDGELNGAIGAITWDPYADCWRPLTPWERDNLRSDSPARKRGADWPLSARWGGWLQRGRRRAPPAGAALIVPEIFSPAVAAALPRLFAAVTGPRVALFHDALALQYPEYSAPNTVARFPAYLRDLLQFDGIAAVSEDSRAALVDYWRWLGVPSAPPVAALPLGIDRPSARAAAAAAPPVILCVSSLEGRKNHLALLAAAESLWQAGQSFQLRLIGLAQPQTGRAALDRIAALQSAGRPLRYDGPVDEAVLEDAYAEAAFTVYPSLREGFGLPVAESLVRGKPCVCSGSRALGEIARAGGCLVLDRVEAPSLAAACARLLGDAGELAALAAAAGRRSFPSWGDYAAALRAWMNSLSRRT